MIFKRGTLFVMFYFLGHQHCQSVSLNDQKKKVTDVFTTLAPTETKSTSMFLKSNEPHSWLFQFFDSFKSGFFIDSKKWYKFLNSLHEKFSEYEIQNNIESYNVSNLEDWGKSNKQQGIHINQHNINQFFSIAEKYNVSEYEYVKRKVLEDFRLKELNQVLKFTLGISVSRRCSESNTIIINGIFVSIKKLKRLNYFKNDLKCPLKTNLPGPTTFVVFALDTVFIDDDIELRGGLLTIISPKWNIIDDRKIDLSGNHGEDQIKNKCQKPADSGKAGNPGGAGGTFFGTGKTFINGPRLTIIVDGGNGGKGQQGCRGMKGADGLHANNTFSKDTNCNSNFCDRYFKHGIFKCERLGPCIMKPCDGCPAVGTLANNIRSGPVDECTFLIYGAQGEVGGPGGDGGVGGQGGKHGFSELLELNITSGIVLAFRSEGLLGAYGQPGAGGVGGRHGYGVLLTCQWSKFTTENYTRISGTGFAWSGAQGRYNSDSQKSPEPNRIHNPSNILNKYKSFLRKNLLDNFQAQSSIEFLKLLDDNEKVKKLYHLLGFFDEVLNFEKEYHQVKIGVAHIPYYNSLLNRINEYSDKVYAKNPDIDLTGFKKSVDYLRATILQRIIDFSQLKESKSRLTADVEDFLLMLKKKVDELKHDKTEQNKADIVDERRKNYKEDIERYINEAEYLIKNVNDDINNVNDQIDFAIQDLVVEVASKKKEEQVNIQDLEKKKQDLQDALAVKQMFSVINILCESLAFLGPVGAFASKVGVQISNEIESLVDKDVDFDTEGVLSLSKAVVKQINNGVSMELALITEKIEKYTKLVEEIEMSSNPQLTPQMLDKLNSFKNKLKGLKKEELNAVKFRKLEKEFKTDFNLEEMGHSKKQKGFDENLNKYSKLFRSIESSGEVILNHIQNLRKKEGKVEEAINTYTAAIIASEEKIQQLEEFREKIFNYISPMIKKVKNDMRNTLDSLQGQSKVFLEYTNWQVQKTLTSVQSEIMNMTSKYAVESKLKNYFKELIDAMTTLIKMYNWIQEFQREEKKADFWSDIVSVAVNSAEITDAAIAEFVRKIDIQIKSNLIVEQYMLAEDAFKQFVFPFAQKYLNQAKEIKRLMIEKDHEKLETFIPAEIDNMINNFHLFKKLHPGGEAFSTGDGEFSPGISSQPFFVWENEFYSDKIADLLSGEEVFLSADITKSKVHYDAVKFKKLSLDLRTKTDTAQFELDRLLKNFKVELIPVFETCYRFESKIYCFKPKRYKYWYHYENNAAGFPRHKSDDYKAIEDGNFLLSPYGKWKMKIVNITNISFQNLTKYKNEVDLMLCGHAHYIEKQGYFDSSELQVNEYYNRHHDYNLENFNLDRLTSKERYLTEKIAEAYRESGYKTHYPPTSKNTDLEDSESDFWYTWDHTNLKINE